jgi:hypothetical protein
MKVVHLKLYDDTKFQDPKFKALSVASILKIHIFVVLELFMIYN